MKISLAEEQLRLPALYLRRFELTYRAIAPLSLPTHPYELASLFRASLHRATTLRFCRSSNPSGRRCQNCQCLYKNIFEHRPSPTHMHARKFSQAPLPYIFRILKSQRKYSIGDTLRIQITLFGKANDQLADFLRLCQQLAPFFPQNHPYHFELDQVVELPFSKEGKKQMLFQEGIFQDNFLQHRLYLQEEIPIDVPQKIELHFQGLTCLQQKGQAMLLPSLNFLAQRIWERAWLLNSFYGTRAYPKQMPDFNTQFSQDQDIVPDSLGISYWRKQKTRRNIPSSKPKTRTTIIGIKGKVHYEGLISKQLYQLLYLGQFLHIGRLTAFGLGAYQLKALEGIPRRPRIRIPQIENVQV